MMNVSEKTEDMNIKNTCRVCLDTIFSESVLLQPGNKWLEQYEYCFGLTIHENDEPRKLCSLCAKHMKEFAHFKKKCHKSHSHWKSITSEVKQYSEDCEVKEEFDESLVKEEIHLEENYFSKFDEIEPKLNHFEEPLSCQYDDTIVYDSGLSRVKKSKDIKLYNKRKTKSRKDKGVIKIQLDSHHCGLCDFISSDVESTTQHLKEHSVNNELTCKICKYKGNDFADMVTHRYEHFPKGGWIFCHQCNKRFQCVKRLEFHYRSEHLNKNGGWCAVCNISFARYRTLRNHEQLQHENVDKYICDHCGKAFLYRHQIVAHLADVAGVKKFVCDSCGGAFKRLSYLKLHMATVHKNDAVKCDHCGTTFKNKYRLQHHLRLVSKKKELICKVCSKAFYHPVSLKEHEFWHSGARPFPCDICGKRYKKKNMLKIHLETHRGIRRHKCTECPKDFVTCSQLKVHSAVHTGVRRYKCAYCERSFHGKKLLAAHCLTKHNIELADKKV